MQFLDNSDRVSRMTYEPPKRRCASVLVSLASLLIADQVGCSGGKLASTSSLEASAYAYGDCFLTALGDVGETSYGGSMTLGRSGSVLTANTAPSGMGVLPTESLRFSPTSSVSATLLPNQDATDLQVSCAPGLFTPTVVQLASGSLTSNRGTVFLSVEGTAEPVDAGNGCTYSGGQGSMFVTCSGGSEGLPGAEADTGSSDAGSGSDFVGVYSCNDVEQSHRAAPNGFDASSGGPGTLTITEAGGVLTAAYADASFIDGSLQFTAKTEAAAVPTTSNQSMQVFCDGSTGPGEDDGGTFSPVLVTASSLTIDGSWVVLSFVGDVTASSGCTGVTMSVSVLCGK